MAEFTPGPSLRFDLLLGACTILLIGVAIIAALWWLFQALGFHAEFTPAVALWRKPTLGFGECRVAAARHIRTELALRANCARLRVPAAQRGVPDGLPLIRAASVGGSSFY